MPLAEFSSASVPGIADTVLGKDAADSLEAGEYYDTFIGAKAGYYNLI